MILFLNTTKDLCQIKLFNTNGSLIDEYEYNGAGNLSEDLLKKINSLLQKNKMSIKDLSTIAVCPGPGSYTGTRIGVTVANAMAISLNIPVVKASKTIPPKITAKNGFLSPVMPIYQRAPHITQRKHRLC